MNYVSNLPGTSKYVLKYGTSKIGELGCKVAAVGIVAFS
jgi:hypothetical protein